MTLIKKFSLSPEQIAVFANDDGPASMMGAYDMLTGAIFNEEKLRKPLKQVKVLIIKIHVQFAFKVLQDFSNPLMKKI